MRRSRWAFLGVRSARVSPTSALDVPGPERMEAACPPWRPGHLRPSDSSTRPQAGAEQSS